MLRHPMIRIARIASALSVGTLLVAGCGGSGNATPSTTTAATADSSPSSAPSLEQQFVAVVRQTQPSVAQIQTDQGLGSGVIFDANGDVVTNAHVLAGASRIRVTLADGRQFPARLVGAYAPDDLAVVSVGAGHALKPARFGDSSKVEVGDIVLAAGNPLGLQSSITDGIVSAVGRNVSEGQGVVLPNAIQTSAPINPGNSGGALVDLQAQVIGIPTLAAGNPQAGGTAAGIGFAIPSNIVQDIAGQIVRNGRVVNSHRAALGVNLADNLARPGAVVTAIQTPGPAEKAGILVGDSIDSIDGKAVASADDLATVLATLRPGKTVKVTITQSDGTSSTKTVTLGELPGS
jgi:putative serine protease PepD